MKKYVVLMLALVLAILPAMAMAAEEPKDAEVKEKVEEVKEEAKEKAEEVKEEAKEKVEEVKEEAKEKVEEVKEEAKEKVEELKEEVKEEVKVQKYEKDGVEYIKLRDLAALLKDTDMKFNVKFNEEKHAVEIVKGESYEMIEDDLKEVDFENAEIDTTTELVYVDGELVKIEGVQINGYNYYSLETLKGLFGEFKLEAAKEEAKKVEEKIEEKAEKVEEKIEEEVEEEKEEVEKPEEKVEEKVEEKPEEKVEEKVEEKPSTGCSTCGK